MGLGRIGPRLTLKEQMSRNPAFKGRLLALEFRTPGGNLLRAKEVFGKRLQMIEKPEIDGLRAFQFRNPVVIGISGLARNIDDLRAPQIPEMISISDKFSIMKEEVTIGLFKQVMQGYVIEGKNADKLKALLADPSKAGERLIFVSLLDAREFAKRLSDLTGRKFRVQTEDEWWKAADKLSGTNWTWTETEANLGSGFYVLLHLSDASASMTSLLSGIRDLNVPEFRYNNFAVRLVEDKIEKPEIDGLRAPQISETIKISNELSIMKEEVTVGLFKQVMQGYAINGHNANKLKALLADPSKAGNSLTSVSLLDAREFAKRLSDLTGRKFRVQTENEWLRAKDLLSGKYWTWTETEYSIGVFILRRWDGDRVNCPGVRYNNYAVRLIEDK